ncbi:MAG: threonine synthase [Opitutae bacterium]|nr:threonine synthase [Opitutae bacterium]
MHFASTRGQSDSVGFSEAVAQGLAPDGGLYLPEKFPDLSASIGQWEDLSYPELCFEFLRLFATDLEADVLRRAIDHSYSAFSHPQIAPIVELSGNCKILELFHGPTLAFKDFALQLLGNLYEHQISRTGKNLTILGATSGDTGAAAISGLIGKRGVTVFILYPNGKVSPLQERQMTCTGASNVFPLAIEGTFDDAQSTVKELFSDLPFRKKVGLSAVNSINLARILAQSVYYLYAWLRLGRSERECTTFVVPTGNFGNVFAGWLLTKMGIAIRGFRVATNQNDVLHRLFHTGEYSLESVVPSLAPSMDIQVASNFERLLFFIFDGDAGRVREVMNSFREKGRYCFENFAAKGFSSSSATDREIPEIIRSVNREYGYLVDPHTACGFKDLPSDEKHLVLATAHPAKFPDVYENAGMEKPTSPILQELLEKTPVKYDSRVAPSAIRAFVENNSSLTSE